MFYSKMPQNWLQHYSRTKNASSTISDFKNGHILKEFYDTKELEQVEKVCTARQNQRLDLIRKGCAKLRQENRFSITSEPKLMNVWFNKPRHLALCTPHKTGSQTWRYFFQQLDLSDHPDDSKEAYMLDTWPTDGHLFLGKECFNSTFPLIDDVVTEFFKRTESTAYNYFLPLGFQVRHPLERLLSSYRFIFERETMRTTNLNLLEYIHHNYAEHKNASEQFDAYKYLPTFKEFCTFVANSGPNFDVDKYPSASHWLPFYNQCNPCHPGE